jgi:hypothetical protein
MSSQITFFNPAADAPEAEKPFALRWELLKLHPSFGKDAKVWTESWHTREALANNWKKLNEQERQSEEGRKLNEQLELLSEQLFAIFHGTLPLYEPVALDSAQEATEHIAIDEENEKRRMKLRGWERAEFVLCALKWMLPAAKYIESPKREVLWKPRMGGKPEEYRPRLSAKDLKENEKFGPLTLSQSWTETSPGFRREFIHACTPGWKGDNVVRLDLNNWAYKLITIANLISPGGADHRRSSAEELTMAKNAILMLADTLNMLDSRFKCFLIPDDRVYSRSQFNMVIDEIEKYFQIFKDGSYRKNALLGRPNQWEARLTAESLPRVNGHLDYYEAAKILVKTPKGEELRKSKPSKLGQGWRREVEDRCNAIEHWIRCVYPFFNPKPYISRTTQRKRERKPN